MVRIISLTVLLLLFAGQCLSEEHTPGAVLDVAKKANCYFMHKHPDPSKPTFVGKMRPSNLWTRAVYYEGLMALDGVSPDTTCLNYALTWADSHKWMPRNGVKTTDADDQCCGQTYFLLADRAGMNIDTRLTYVLDNLQRQMHTRRYDYWTWIDAIQMAMPLYAMAYHFTGDRAFLDYAMQCYRWSRDSCAGKGLFNQQSGLWYRDKDYLPPYREPDGQPCYWSRGDGWVYAALARVMQTIGKEDKYYQELKHDFVLMSKAVIACQRTDGLWNPSLVSTHYEGEELSGTALFLYGMSWGIRQGLLSKKKYYLPCQKAWEGMVNKCIHPDGFLGFVQGTGKDPSAGQPLSYSKVPDFEDYGTGCFLLGASEYYRLLKQKK